MKIGNVKYSYILILSASTAIFLIYILLGLIIFKKQVFIEREILSFPEILIGFGFVLILVFNIVSIIWLVRNPDIPCKTTAGKVLIIALGVLCLFLLIGDKTMADEIGRESLIGWETLGEWIILYVFLIIQLAYNSIIIKLSVKNTRQIKKKLSDLSR